MKDYRGAHGFGRCDLCGKSICRVFYSAFVGGELHGKVCPCCREARPVKIVSRFQRRGSEQVFTRTHYNWNF